MHILLIHQAFTAIDEAGGTRHIEMATFLAQKGHRVTIIASPISYLTGKRMGEGRPAWKEKRSLADGITLIRTYTYPALHKSFVHRVFSFLSFMLSSFLAGLTVGKVDLVWGTSPPIFQAVTAWLLARLHRAPFLLEIRDLWPAFAEAAGVLRNRPLIAASRWLERFLYRRADRVVVNSPGFIQHVLDRGARWVECVPNGADVEAIGSSQDGSSFRQEHSLGNSFIALYAGAHGMSNDLGMVLAAAEKLKERPDILFVLVGDGKDKPALQREAQARHLENVRFLAPVSKRTMPAVLAAADAGIAILKPLELYKTTYPNKVFDYMAAGRPVLLAIDGVSRAVVERAGAGIYIPPGDAQALAGAVSKLAGNRELSQAMGARGQAYARRHFGRAKLAEQFRLMIEEMRRL